MAFTCTGLPATRGAARAVQSRQEGQLCPARPEPARRAGGRLASFFHGEAVHRARWNGSSETRRVRTFVPRVVAESTPAPEATAAPPAPLAAELAVWAGHDMRVTAMSMSPDGTRLATCSWDKTIKVWDTSRLGTEELAMMRGHIGFVEGLGFSPDGKLLASASRDSTIRVWNAEDWSQVATLEGHTQWAFGAAFSPCGKFLASASYDGCIKIWDTTTWTQVAIMLGHADGIRSIAWSPDGRRLVSASLDNSLRVWRAGSWDEEACLEGHSDCVRCCGFLQPARGEDLSLEECSRFLFSGGEDRVVRIWDLDSMQEVGKSGEHGTWINGAVFSAKRDGEGLAGKLLTLDEQALRCFQFTIAADGEANVNSDAVGLARDQASRFVLRPDSSEVVVGDGAGVLSVLTLPFL
eukprot:tig00000402_g188.t1